MPRVSVIIPTRNRPSLLVDALGSVLGQDYRDLEVLVVDDASVDPDENARVIERFGGPVRHLVREQSGGPSAARNTGLRASDSEYIAFLDDDDIWLPSKLRRQVEVFEANPRKLSRLGVVYCWHQWIDLRAGRVQARRLARIDGIDDLIRTRYNIVQTILVKRMCVDEVGGFDHTIAGRENLEFLARMIQRYRFDRVDDVLVLCRVHSGPRTSDDLPAIIAGHERVLQTGRAANATPAVLAGEQYRLARCLMAVGAMREARMNLVEAIGAARGFVRVKYAVFLALSYVARLVRPNFRSALLKYGANVLRRGS